MPHMLALYVCLIRMLYMYALHLCLICTTVTCPHVRAYMHALYVCLALIPYMHHACRPCIYAESQVNQEEAVLYACPAYTSYEYA